ncbi:hypothetical protein NLG97_g1596 [Lecanicillium saksenae]|uniref:Uncharacterized protein n=1 Tax=Lecanicillium saksenae TaxID=468837 RepID=A0ACC1R6L4_9HYPO|nr:hypothetical protein NLG97_g1596 [Lecanicillium saksenae]
MCETAWALRILDSINIVIYGAGFYSFFQNNELGCTEHESCQKAMIQTSFSEYVYMYNIFTKGNQEVVTPAAAGHVKSLLFDDSTRNGYTSEVAAWLPLALDPAADWGDHDISAGTDTGDGDNGIDDRPVCDFSRHFNSLEDIANADDLSSMCRALLSFPFLVDKLDQIYADYQEANKGYDEVFPYYEKYFRYIASEMIANCTTEQDPIFHCKDDNGPWESCEALLKRVVWDDYYTITWECLDRGKYESALLNDYAIPKDWVQYANKSDPFHCHNPGHAIDWDCSDKDHTNYNMPMLADHVDVPNPKDIIARAGQRFSSVKMMLFATYADMLLSQWSGPYEDALDSLSTPVSLLAQAVQSMKDDKAIGEAIHEQEVRNNILNILGIIFSVMPFAGDLLLPAGVAFSFVGKIVGLIGEVGDQALNIYSVTQSPETAPLALMGGLMGFLGPRIPKLARTGAGFKDLKPPKDIINEQGIMGKYGKVAKAFNDQIGKILKACGK